VSSITFYSGPNTDEMIKLRTVEVETRLLGGWVNCPLTGTVLMSLSKYSTHWLMYLLLRIHRQRHSFRTEGSR
jgi:hypothetical protein